MPREHGRERGNTLRVYLNAQGAWAREERRLGMERVYKTMRNIGALSIGVGIVVTVIGIAAGTISIINGAFLLKRKSEITF
ncbi:hypothetical protein SAMN05443270_4218 [Lacrimispora sphenoides]|jgi:hypothetical protein|nr:hypothetical protein SAMN05443270_4218 [Lacrimispora sphenoides]